MAILLVVLHHAAQFTPAPTSPALRTVYDAVLAGWMGVDVFFVLSGFLITGILLDARGDGQRPPVGYFRSFYARRVLRIFPLYYLFVGAILLFHPTATSHGTWWLWLFLTNVLVSRYGWDAAPPATGHLWSLAVEEQFYLIWPALIATLPRRVFRTTAITLVFAAPALRAILWAVGESRGAYVLTLPRADALALGACVAFLVRDRRRYIETAWIVAGIALAGLVFLLAYDRLATQYSLWALLGGSDCVALLTAAAIYLVVVAPGALRWLSNPALVSLGAYSYAIYLIHVPMRHAISTWVTAHASGTIPVFLGIATGLLVCSWCAAWVLWRVIERPALSLKRFVPMPITPAPSPGAVAEWETARR